MHTLTHDEVVDTAGAGTRTYILSNALGLCDKAQVGLYEVVVWGWIDFLFLRNFSQSREDSFR